MHHSSGRAILPVRIAIDPHHFVGSHDPSSTTLRRNAAFACLPSCHDTGLGYLDSGVGCTIRRRPLGAPDDAALWSGDRHCDFTLWQFGNFYLQMRAYDREMASSYRPELGEPVRLGQIDMPKGTKLELAVADTVESFNRAVFPIPCGSRMSMPSRSPAISR